MRKDLRGAFRGVGQLHMLPLVYPRRLRTMIDAVFTVAVGAVCACALTLGPVPVNTVAATTALSADAGQGGFDQADKGVVGTPTTAPPRDPAEDNRAEDDAADSDVPAPEPSDDPGTEASVKTSTPPAASARPQSGEKRDEASEPAPVGPVRDFRARPAPDDYNPAAAKFGTEPSKALLTTIDAFRVASGLSALVGTASCHNPSLHAEVRLTPGGTLPPSRARATLAPGSAHATVTTAGDGRMTVNVYACG